MVTQGLERHPSAVAAEFMMHGNPINVLVEGQSDKKYWSNVFHDDVRIKPCDGYDKVISISKELSNKPILSFAIIDKDFREYIKTEDSPLGDYFITNEHDLELMMYNSKAFLKILNGYGIELSMNEKKMLCASIIEVAKQIGCLCLASKLVNGDLIFKSCEKHRFVFPKYESIMEFKDSKCKFTSDSDLHERIKIFKTNNTKSTWDKVITKHNEIKSNYDAYDAWQVANGHHVSYLLAFLLHKDLIPNHQNASYADVEERLYLAFSKDLLAKTDLYKSLTAWETAHGVTLFANE